jgi:predicted  nucleic acid-binding Zn-ribbon protein
LANDVRIRATVDDKVSGKLTKIRDDFDRLGKGAASASFAGNVGAQALAKGFGLLDQAGSAVIHMLGEANQAALEEERSISKLDAALRANVDSYDGNAAAVEKVIASRIRLGYADDEQRDSLAVLVSVTKDATKALDLQRTAMDLARLRGMDLATASLLIGKVHAGNIGILSRYGIQLEKGTTATEALAEIQRRAAGQAEAYARDGIGKVEAAQIRLDEAMEKLGAHTVPLYTDAMVGAAAVTDLLTGELPETEQGALDLTDALLGIASLVPGLGGQISQLARDNMPEATDAMKDMQHEGSGLRRDFGKTGDAVGDMAGDIDDAAKDSKRSFRDMVESMADNAQSLIDDVFDPIETRADIYQSRMEQNAAEERLRDAETAREKREATDDIMASISDQADSLVDLSKQGKLTERDIDRFEKDVKQSYAALGKRVPKEIQTIIEKLRALDRWDGHVINVKTRFSTVSGGNVGGKVVGTPHRAKGGPASGLTVVGEEGPELVDLPSGSYVHSNPDSKRMAATLGGGESMSLTVNVYPAPGMTPAMARAFGEAVGPALTAWQQRNGVLPRTGSPLRG